MEANFRNSSTDLETKMPGVSKTSSSFSMCLPGESDPLTWATTTWRNKDDSSNPLRGLVFLCHGYGEYLSKSYDFLAQELTKQNFLVFGHDHLGHGNSGGERVQILESYERDYVTPVLEHCRKMKADHPGVPLFIVGHSMGGLVTLLTLLSAQGKEDTMFAGCVLMAPLIEVDPSMGTPLNIFLARILKSTLPWIQISGVKKDFVTRDRSEVERMKNDPLYWSGGIKVKQGYAGLKALETLGEKMGDIQLPILIQQGEEDKIVRPQGAEKLYNAIVSKDKDLKTYPEAYHDMYIELHDVRDLVVKDCIEWLLKRL